MEFLTTLPVGLMALAIFLARIVDVSLGTVRTLSIVRGQVRLAMAVGFLEVLIWITVVSGVIARVHDTPLLLFAYAAGFAAGNGVGILLERKLALGISVVRIFSATQGQRVAEVLREEGQGVTTFQGEGLEGPVTLVYATTPRKDVPLLVRSALAVDPQAFYVIENAQEWNRHTHPRQPHGDLRSVIKRK
ncbi:MAG: DUF5698 domain-containing protein [Myxococcota bacterium]|nr:DUF5698 domain-containing protein [Myxococcota bacterium]